MKILERLKHHFTDNTKALEALETLKECLRENPLEKVETDNTGDPYPLPKNVSFGPDEIIYFAFTDGACRGNPGPGAWGCMAQSRHGEVLFEASGVDVNTTNNRMELQAPFEVLQRLADLMKDEGEDVGASQIHLYSDSKYVVDGMKSWVEGWKRRGWKKADKKVPENVELWQNLDSFREKFEQVHFHWVKGHNGHPQNERCDRLANEALDESGF